MKRLLPVVLALGAIAIGTWAWKGGADVVAADRIFEIVPRPPLQNIGRVEAEVWREGALLRRVEWNTPSGVVAPLTVPLALHRGKVQVRTVVHRQNAPEPTLKEHEVMVADGETLTVRE